LSFGACLAITCVALPAPGKEGSFEQVALPVFEGCPMITYRPEVDGLRAIAIASVVLYHAAGAIFSGGFVGVDIFFVISGYLITSIILKEAREDAFSYMNFYARRARRILPALLAMLVVVTLAAFVLLLPADLYSYSDLLIHALFFSANFPLASSPGYFDATMQENPLLHIWSLSVEEQFYLIWPTLLLLVLRIFSRRGQILAVLLLAAASLILAEATAHTWPRSAFFHLHARGWELLAGAVLAMDLLPQATNRKLCEGLSILGLALMCGPILLYTKETVFPGLSALPPVTGCALVIYANGTGRTKIASLLSWQPVAFLGLISYSLYLWHWPILAFPAYILVRPLEPIESLLCVAASLLLAVLSWRYIERPFRKRLATRLGNLVEFERFSIPALTQSGYAALAVVLALTGSGAAIQHAWGAAWRYSSDIREITEIAPPPSKIDVCITEYRPRGAPIECHFGDGSARVILWGDSHSGSYLSTVVKVYRNGRAFIHYGCLPLAGIKRVTLAGEDLNPACMESRPKVIEKILQLKPKILLIAGRWTLSEDLPYGRELKPNSYLTGDSGDLSRESSRRIFAAAIANTAAIFTKAGIKVVLLGQVPEMTVSPRHCLALSKLFGLANGNCGFVPREEAERRQYYVNQGLNAAARSNPDVFVFRPFDSMCGESRCEAVRNGKVLYIDGDHLGRDGANLLVEPLRLALPAAFQLPSERIRPAGPASEAVMR
jgi:peptidoglycan/LPS O-acetylase OafA/YrhL